MDTNSRETVATLAHRTLTQRTRLDVLGGLRSFEQAIAEFKRAAVLPSSEPAQLVAAAREMQAGLEDLVKLINDGTQSFHVLSQSPTQRDRCSGCGVDLTDKDRARLAVLAPDARKLCEFCK